MRTLMMPTVENPHPYGPPVPYRTTDIFDLIHIVAREWGVRVAGIMSGRRGGGIVLPRHIAMFLAWQHTNHSLAVIGRCFGGRDHSTILHAIRKIRRLLIEDSALAQRVELIERRWKL